MPKTGRQADTVVDDTEAGVRRAERVTPPAAKLGKDEIRKVVGAKNVMGTCSG
jgi:hypothetical protein